MRHEMRSQFQYTTSHNISSLYVGEYNIISFVETSRKSKYIIAKLLIRTFIFSTNEDPSSRIDNFAIIYLRGVPTKLN